MNRYTRILAALAAVSVFAPATAGALTLGEIDSAAFDSITGDIVASSSNSFDFLPSVNGGDGLVTSTVYAGTGTADGLYVYSYQIELYPTPPSSVGAVVAMSWEFGEMPVAVDGLEESFFIGDDGGTVAPLAALYEDGEATIYFIPAIGNGEVSNTFGMLSPNAPKLTVAQLTDSGAPGGTVEVFSNGISPTVPEPSAALVFALGFLLVRPLARRARA
jgi:hypothetical protein